MFERVARGRELSSIASIQATIEGCRDEDGERSKVSERDGEDGSISLDRSLRSRGFLRTWVREGGGERGKYVASRGLFFLKKKSANTSQVNW